MYCNSHVTQLCPQAAASQCQSCCGIGTLTPRPAKTHPEATSKSEVTGVPAASCPNCLIQEQTQCKAPLFASYFPVTSQFIFTTSVGIRSSETIGELTWKLKEFIAIPILSLQMCELFKGLQEYSVSKIHYFELPLVVLSMGMGCPPASVSEGRSENNLGELVLSSTTRV